MGVEDWECKYKESNVNVLDDYLDQEEEQWENEDDKNIIYCMTSGPSEPKGSRFYQTVECDTVSPEENCDTLDRRWEKKRGIGSREVRLVYKEAGSFEDETSPPEISIIPTIEHCHQHWAEPMLSQEAKKEKLNFKDELLFKTRMWAKHNLEDILENYAAYQEGELAKQNVRIECDSDGSEELPNSIGSEEELEEMDPVFLPDAIHSINESYYGQGSYLSSYSGSTEKFQGYWDKKNGRGKGGSWASEAVLSPVEEPSDEYVDTIDELQNLVETVSEYLAEKEEEINKYESLPKIVKSKMPPQISTKKQCFGEDQNVFPEETKEETAAEPKAHTPVEQGIAGVKNAMSSLFNSLTDKIATNQQSDASEIQAQTPTPASVAAPAESGLSKLFSFMPKSAGSTPVAIVSPASKEPPSEKKFSLQYLLPFQSSESNKQHDSNQEVQKVVSEAQTKISVAEDVLETTECKEDPNKKILPEAATVNCTESEVKADTSFITRISQECLLAEDIAEEKTGLHEEKVMDKESCIIIGEPDSTNMDKAGPTVESVQKTPAECKPVPEAKHPPAKSVFNISGLSAPTFGFMSGARDSGKTFGSLFSSPPTIPKVPLVSVAEEGLLSGLKSFSAGLFQEGKPATLKEESSAASVIGSKPGFPWQTPETQKAEINLNVACEAKTNENPVTVDDTISDTQLNKITGASDEGKNAESSDIDESMSSKGRHILDNTQECSETHMQDSFISPEPQFLSNSTDDPQVCVSQPEPPPQDKKEKDSELLSGSDPTAELLKKHVSKSPVDSSHFGSSGNLSQTSSQLCSDPEERFNQDPPQVFHSSSSHCVFKRKTTLNEEEKNELQSPLDLDQTPVIDKISGIQGPKTLEKRPEKTCSSILDVGPPPISPSRLHWLKAINKVRVQLQEIRSVGVEYKKSTVFSGEVENAKCSGWKFCCRAEMSTPSLRRVGSLHLCQMLLHYSDAHL
ncbi:hypothetical protein GN956_G19090 [Arapaima gigas]